MDLRRDQPVSLHYQLKTLLTGQILGGAYGAEGRLPTELQLCERFGSGRAAGNGG
jgi:DNA-binding GntR family transcriptional regulator